MTLRSSHWTLFGFVTALVLMGCASTPEPEERERSSSKYMIDLCERIGACDKGGPAGPGPQSPCTGTGESCFPHANDRSEGSDNVGAGDESGAGEWSDGFGSNGGPADPGDQGGWGDQGG